MKNFIAVFLGSGLGGMIRYAIHLMFQKTENYIPYQTFIANFIACVLVGFLIQKYFLQGQNEVWRLFAVIGFCGGLSTYSTYAYELFTLSSRDQFVAFTVYALGTFVLCLLGIYLGILLAK